MALTLLRTRSVGRAEALLEKSFGQYQNVHGQDDWSIRERNARARLGDLRGRTFRHPSIRCTERTLAQFIHANHEVVESQAQLRQLKREHFRASRGGRGGGRLTDPGQRMEKHKRNIAAASRRLNDSPCRHCPYLMEHRAQHWEISDLEALLRQMEPAVRGHPLQGLVTRTRETLERDLIRRV